jgi:ABC-type Fe3+ transport system substrate-binding protein
LSSKKREGQFRALWGDFGELVNLLASGEMILADAWQPAVMAVKAQGIPCSYAVPREGYRAWSIGISQIANSPNGDAVRAYADYWLSGPPAITVSEQGYYSPTTNIEQVMPADRYGFWYEGQPWQGPPDRGIVEGELRDGGSLEERASHVAYWHQWPDEYDHLTQRWEEFLSF